MLDAPQHGPRPLPLFLEMLREKTAASADRRAAALAGLRAYQEAPRDRPRALPDAGPAQGRARLRDYGGAGRDVVFVPSLINPPFILDLAPQKSLLRWCSEQGLRPWLLDWGAPGPTDRDEDIDAHIERILVPLIAQFAAPPLLVGYCLGGTMALGAAAIAPVAGVAAIAAPWRFSGFGAGRAAIAFGFALFDLASWLFFVLMLLWGLCSGVKRTTEQTTLRYVRWRKRRRAARERRLALLRPAV